MRKTILLLLLVCTSCLRAWADRGGFYYTHWSVEAQVSAKNEWQIHEVENVYFNEYRHGIYRYIPLDFYAGLNIAPEGEPQHTPVRHYFPEVEIKSASGDEVYIYDDDNNNRIVRFGKEYEEVIGDMKYTIDYRYLFPDDRIDARDFIYFTMKPGDIEEEVKQFRFDIQFEKPLPDDIADRLTIFLGRQGESFACQSFDTLVVTPTRITGVISDIYSHQAVTIYAELPQGFWEDTKKTDPLWAHICCWIALALGGLLLFKELTRKFESLDKSVEFYAPDDITPSEVGVIIDDSSDIIDLTALVPWLAQHGYITIREIEKSGFLKKSTDIELTKIHELPSYAPEYQKAIMDMLFPDDDNVQLMSELGQHPDKVNNAKKELANCFKGKQKLVEVKHGWLVFFLMLTSYLAFVFSNPARVSSIEFLTFGLVWLAPFAAAFALRVKQSPKDVFRTRTMLLVNRVLRLMAFALNMVIMSFVIWDGEENQLSIIEIVALVAVCFFVSELSNRLVFDTPFRKSLKGRLLGFKEFIETAEKDRLKMLVDYDPEYFYSVLPYAMVFDLTDKWVNQFKDIAIEKVSWYQTSNAYNSYGYIHGLSQGMSRTVNNAITTSSHSKSSGGSGGFSGGGGGGGGGGSW